MKKNVLLTGASGFLGQLAIKYLSKYYFLYCIDRVSYDSNVTQVDLNYYDQIDLFVKNKKIDIIVHFASDIFDTKEKLVYNNNINSVLNLIKVSKKYKINKFYFSSTFSIYEINYNFLIKETEPITAKNIYGISKAESERILLSSDNELNVIIFRLPIVVDVSRVHRLGIIFEFIKDGKKIFIPVSGDNRIQFVYAKDIFRCILKSENLLGKKVYNLGCKTNRSIKEVIKYVIKKTKSKSIVISLPKEITLYVLKILSFLKLIDFTNYHNRILTSNLVLDCSRIKKDLNISFKFTSEEIFLKAFNYYCKNYSQIQKISSSSRKKPSMKFFKIIKYLS